MTWLTWGFIRRTPDGCQSKRPMNESVCKILCTFKCSPGAVCLIAIAYNLCAKVRVPFRIVLVEMTNFVKAMYLYQTVYIFYVNWFIFVLVFGSINTLNTQYQKGTYIMNSTHWHIIENSNPLFANRSRLQFFASWNIVGFWYFRWILYVINSFIQYLVTGKNKETVLEKKWIKCIVTRST